MAWMNSPFPMYIPVCVIFAGAPKKSRSPGLQLVPFHRLHSVPRGLKTGVPRYYNPPPPREHLGKPGAVVAEGRGAAPKVRQAYESSRQSDGFIYSDRLQAAGDVPPLNPRLSLIRQADLNPAAILLFRFGEHFQAAFKRNREHRSVRCNIGIAVKVGKQAANF